MSNKKIQEQIREVSSKIRIYQPFKFSRTKDKGFASYTCYYKGHSIDVFGVYSPKAAIRLVNKLIQKGEL